MVEERIVISVCVKPHLFYHAVKGLCVEGVLVLDIIAVSGIHVMELYLYKSFYPRVRMDIRSPSYFVLILYQHLCLPPFLRIHFR